MHTQLVIWLERNSFLRDLQAIFVVLEVESVINSSFHSFAGVFPSGEIYIWT